MPFKYSIKQIPKCKRGERGMFPWQWATPQGLTFLSFCSWGWYLPAALILALFSHPLFAWYQLRTVSAASREYLLDLIAFTFLQWGRVNGTKQRDDFEYLTLLRLLSSLYMPVLWPFSCSHTFTPPALILLAHVHPEFFTNLGFDSCTEKREFCHQFPWDQTQSAFVTKGDWHVQHSIFHWKQTPDKARNYSYIKPKALFFSCEEAVMHVATAGVTVCVGTSSWSNSSLTRGSCLTPI